MDKIKNLGEVYTPSWVVNLILKECGFIDDKDKFKKKIIDPACGDGAFLGEILKILIKENCPIDIIPDLIYGWDINKKAIKECISNLNQILKDNKIEIKVKWKNIEARNSIKFNNKNTDLFDYVVGNPPYVRIQNLNQKQRIYIQKNYSFCKNGSTDLYIAFFELGQKLLNKTGILSFISPNGYIKNNTGKAIRDFFIKNKSIKSIIDFGDIQIFDGVTTYTIITTINKEENNSFMCRKIDNVGKINEQFIVSLKELDKEYWILQNSKVLKSINTVGTELGKIAKIRVGIATLSDSCFIFKNPIFCDNFVIIKPIIDGNEMEYKIEKNILKPIIKGSTLKSTNHNQNIWILFPYKKENGKHIIIPENEIKEFFPLAYSYLSSIKWKLDLRDGGKKNKVAWYAFGRSQGLDTSFGKKIITSPINEKPKFIVCEDENSTFYSGYGIFYDGDLYKLCEKLNSNGMELFINSSSKNYRGGFKSYSKTFIKNYKIIDDMDRK